MPVLSRRAALVRMLKLGIAPVTFVMVGWQVKQSTGSEQPSPQSALQPPLAATAVPTAPLDVTPMPSPRPIELRLDVIPARLMIASLGIDAPVATAQTARGPGGAYEIVVPESGIVSPNSILGNKSVNNVWILGHSRWHRIPQLLYTLASLNPGDDIAIAGTERATGRELPTLPFEVDRLILADTDTTAAEVYGVQPEIPRLIIQTSARQAWDPEWILDRDTILSKAEVNLAGDMDDLSRYLLLLVTARLHEDTLAALLANS